MSKVVVIGAGASGIIASLMASKNNEVILLDSNNKIGKKILITGNGRCNYWNSDIDCKYYNTDDVNNLSIILKEKEKVLSFLNNCGLYPKVKDNYYYPNSNQASTVVELFNNELVKNNVQVVYNCKVYDIHKSGEKFVVKSNLADIMCDKVIISTGSCAYPKTGSDGSGYKLVEKIHAINKVYPSLVSINCKGDFFKDWNNLRVDAMVSLQIDDKIIDSEKGEIQLTSYGISGIPAFNISGKVNRNIEKNIKVIIDFLPDQNALELLNERISKKPDYSISELLETVLPYQLIEVLLKKANIKKDTKASSIDKEELAKLINCFSLDVIDTLSFDRSQVATGGVSLKEINPETMESLKMPGLYLTGEILDVDGKCGGFNLGFAFITGYIAGRNV